jgi:hypothetical protein
LLRPFPGTAGSRYQHVALLPRAKREMATARLRSNLPGFEPAPAGSCGASRSSQAAPPSARLRAAAATTPRHFEHCGKCSRTCCSSSSGMVPRVSAASVGALRHLVLRFLFTDPARGQRVAVMPATDPLRSLRVDRPRLPGATVGSCISSCILRTGIVQLRRVDERPFVIDQPASWCAADLRSNGQRLGRQAPHLEPDAVNDLGHILSSVARLASGESPRASPMFHAKRQPRGDGMGACALGHVALEGG